MYVYERCTCVFLNVCVYACVSVGMWVYCVYDCKRGCMHECVRVFTYVNGCTRVRVLVCVRADGINVCCAATQKRRASMEAGPLVRVKHGGVGAHAFAAAVAAVAPLEVMLADAGTPAVLAGVPPAVMLADAGAPAVLALAPDAGMLADAGAPAVLALAPDAVMLADAGAPAVLALAPAAVMLADAGAPAVLALAPDTVMLADAALAVLAPAPLEAMLALLAPPLRCALPLPLPPPFPPAPRLPLLRRILGLLPRRVAVSPLLAALAALAPLLPVPHLRHWPGALAQVHWAQQRAGVRPTDSPHTGQARARSSSAALPGAGGADPGPGMAI